MSKISQYLNEHILGEVTDAEQVKRQFSRDGSILSVTPELIAHPRLTNDIRKIARFTWQLAEKGHIMPITVRGGGTDQTGAAIGKGIIINTMSHLNEIIYINLKDKDQFVHVQSGAIIGTINEVLKSNGMFVPSVPTSAAFSTIGGAVANNAGGPLSDTYGPLSDSVSRLEVVLANGDVIETGRISHHELDKKKGLQTLEGEIYRKIDGLIEDNQQLINDKILPNPRENCGYSGIAKVKERNGSFDLTPLFVGSQGTLGIISELVIKTQFYPNEESIIVASFNDQKVARQTADELKDLKPTMLEYIDSELFAIARKHGKKFLFDKPDANDSSASVLYISFSDFSAKARHRNMKKVIKVLSKAEAGVLTSDDYSNEELRAILEVSASVLQPESKDDSFPSLIDGASVPVDKLEDFISSVNELAEKQHVELPLQIRWQSGVIRTRPCLQLHIISDKQKVFRLMSEYASLVSSFGGCMVTESSEGRLKTTATYCQIDKDVLALYEQIRTTFDPFGTLNPEVKQSLELKTLISQLNPSYDLTNVSKHSPHI